jgi:hypothetical protein
VAQLTMKRTALGEYYNEDDARLIVAAPDLLELARRVSTTCTGCRGEDGSGMHWRGEGGCVAAQAIELLARIEGAPL